MIKENVQKLFAQLGPTVKIVAAVKARSVNEILEAIDAGIEIIGENYVKEAEGIYQAIGKKVKWHFIGNLQKNKVKKAVELFDLIETVDSFAIAKEIDTCAASLNKIIPVFVEINSAKEKSKFGVLPEQAEELINEISRLPHLKVMGLMTMGPYSSNPEDLRPYFALTKNIFEKLKPLNLTNMQMLYLSMGMSDSYKVAIEEGANMVRIGTRIFGARHNSC